jgi:hypothetical protein
MRAFAAAVFVVLLAGCGGGSSAPRSAGAPVSRVSGRCEPATVHRAPYPGHGKGLEGLPWIAGQPPDTGLTGLLWYPTHASKARIWAGGTSPNGANTKILWVFLGRSTPDRADTTLHVTARRMPGPGKFSGSFTGVGYEGSDGAPSYASIINLPRPGCWRLTLRTGSLRATVDMHAVPHRG